MDLTQFSLAAKARADTVKRHAEELLEVTASLLGKAKKLNCQCVHCKQVSELGSWSFVQDYYYISPSGCTDGDYWLPNRTDLCYIACPNCNKMNYIYNHPMKAQLLQVITAPGIHIRDLFAGLYDKHEKSVTAA